MMNFFESYCAALTAATVARTDAECSAAIDREASAIDGIIATPARSLPELAAKMEVLHAEIELAEEEGWPEDGRLLRLAASARGDAKRLASM